MKIYCMADIHGFIEPFEAALSLVLPALQDSDTRLFLLGDYVHGPNDEMVLNRIMSLQETYGGRITVLLGNHEEMVLDGRQPLTGADSISKEKLQKYKAWMKKLPRYKQEGNAIFVHAGIDEEAEDLWKVGTPDFVFTEKYPAQTGFFPGGQKIIAGHEGTASISGDPDFHDIYYDGMSHFYIDGSVYESGRIPVLLYDSDKEEYYSITAGDNTLTLLSRRGK